MISQGFKKELRLLFPEWITALVLASTPLALFLFGLTGLQSITLLFLAIGCVWLATGVLGKENNIGTLESMLSLPITRQQIWRRKCFIAFTTIGTTMAIFLVCLGLTNLWAPLGATNPDFSEYLEAIGLILLCSIGPAFFFTSFQCRFHEAFWITLLTPVGFVVAIVMATPDSLVEYQSQIILGILTLYGLSTLWLARTRVLNWEATSPIHQNIAFQFPKLWFLTPNKKGSTHTGFKATRSIIAKEWRLHQLTLFATITFAIIYGISISILGDEAWLNTITEELIIDIRSAWLLIPAMIGATAIAEERRLGVASWHSTLPVSRLRQWTIKILVALGLGFVLGALVPWPLDTYLLSIREASPDSQTIVRDSGHITATMNLLSWGCPVLATVIGFYASSMARNLLQGISIAVLVTIALLFQVWIANLSLSKQATVDPTYLICLVLALVMVPVLIYQSFRNYPIRPSLRSATKPLIAIWIVTTVLVSTITTAAFSRFWEPWLPMPSIVDRTASPNTQAQILEDQWGLTILSGEGTLYHISQQFNKEPTQIPSIRRIGPDQTWKSLALAHRNRFAITQEGTLWAWHRSQDFPQIYKERSSPPSTIDSTIPWEQIVTGHRQVYDTYHTYLYGLKTDGSLHIAQMPKEGVDYAFQQVPISERFRSITTTDHYILGITLDDKLALIGPDTSHLIHPYDPRENYQPTPINEDAFQEHLLALSRIHFLDETTEWKAIHPHKRAVRMPVAGYPYHLLGSEENRAQLANYSRFMASTSEYPIPFFEREDGSIWTQEWAAKALHDQTSEIGDSHQLVQLKENLWKTSFGVQRNHLSLYRRIALKTDGSLWEINRTDYPEVPFFPELTQVAKKLNQRSDWTAIQSYHIDLSMLGITANDILWTWGKPLERLHYYLGDRKEGAIPLIPYQQTPRPLYDLREGKLISP